MKIRFLVNLRIVGVLLCLAASSGLVGCKDSGESSGSPAAAGGDTHDDEHEHPTTLAGALETLLKQKETIQKAFEAGDPESAHDPLHEIGHTLELIPEMAAKVESLGEEGQAAVKTAVDDLFDGFTALDEVMHGGKEISYADVGTKIDDALAVLKEKLSDK